MKCLVFSDSHGYSLFMMRAAAKHPDAEVIFFLGDGLSDLEHLFERYPDRCYLAVRGNCDREVVALGKGVPKTDRIELCGKKIVFSHGDLYGVKFGIEGLERLAASEDADIVLFGHTHSPTSAYIPKEEGGADEDVSEEGKKPRRPYYIFNPGSIGMLGSPTFGVITLTEGQEPLFSFGSFN
ncbi:MAG: metallophosphoesterase family protein [Clostridia bacterium]|nr:metallophosphoesterase family protein [Clostridia bacterium]